MNTGYNQYYHIRIPRVESFKMRGNNMGFWFHWAELWVFEEFWMSIIFDLSSISWEIHIRLWLKLAFLDSAHSELSFEYKQDRVWIKTVFSMNVLIGIKKNWWYAITHNFWADNFFLWTPHGVLLKMTSSFFGTALCPTKPIF